MVLNCCRGTRSALTSPERSAVEQACGGSLGAVVLCGGASARMGRPKALLPFGDERLVERVTRITAGVCRPVVVVSAPGQVLEAAGRGVIHAHDRAPGLGPLEGLRAGLAALPEDVEIAFACAVDAPFVLPALITRLGKLLGRHDAAMPFVGVRPHPLCAVYRRATCLPAIERLLATGVRAAWRLAEHLDVVRVTRDQVAEVDPELQSFVNMNTPEDYASALETYRVMGA